MSEQECPGVMVTRFDPRSLVSVLFDSATTRIVFTEAFCGFPYNGLPEAQKPVAIFMKIHKS